ncbi:MAG: hypothetical protein ABIR19_02140 [Ginsengibacter sp.]
MKQTAIFLFLISAISLQSIAQYDYVSDPYYTSKYSVELGGSLGVMNSFTDLGGHKGIGKGFITDLNIGNTKLAGSVYVSIAYQNFIVLRFEGSYGYVKANDHALTKNSGDAIFRYSRNLSFRSEINEIMLATEIHPVYARRYAAGEHIPLLSPYLVGGIGYFSFKPQAHLDGNWVSLQPLSTEGQGFSEYPDRKKYSLHQFNFPVGAGLKYKFSPVVNGAVECVYRILNTDYLDDVSTNYIDREVFSKHLTGKNLENALLLNDRKNEINPSLSAFPGEQRGNPGKNDAYFTINFKLGLVF